MLTNIQNGQISRRFFIIQKKKKHCEPILNALWNEGFIYGYSSSEKHIKIFLKYSKNVPAIMNLKILSKPGNKKYLTAKQIAKINKNKLFIIFSTSKGIKTISECKKENIGGEVLVLMN